MSEPSGEDIRTVLKDLADDLASELDARYPASARKYPSEEARYQRDMENVYKARALFDMLAGRIDLLEKIILAHETLQDARKDGLPHPDWTHRLAK